MGKGVRWLVLACLAWASLGNARAGDPCAAPFDTAASYASRIAAVACAEHRLWYYLRAHRLQLLSQVGQAGRPRRLLVVGAPGPALQHPGHVQVFLRHQPGLPGRLAQRLARPADKGVALRVFPGARVVQYHHDRRSGVSLRPDHPAALLRQRAEAAGVHAGRRRQLRQRNPFVQTNRPLAG